MQLVEDLDYPLRHITITQNSNKDITKFWLCKLANKRCVHKVTVTFLSFGEMAHSILVNHAYIREELLRVPVTET